MKSVSKSFLSPHFPMKSANFQIFPLHGLLLSLLLLLHLSVILCDVEQQICFILIKPIIFYDVRASCDVREGELFNGTNERTYLRLTGDEKYIFSVESSEIR